MGSFVLLIQPIFYIIERSDWYTSILDPERYENEKNEQNLKNENQESEEGEESE